MTNPDLQAKRVAALQAIGLSFDQAKQIDEHVLEAIDDAFKAAEAVIDRLPEIFQDLAFAAFWGAMAAQGLAARDKMVDKMADDDGKATIQ